MRPDIAKAWAKELRSGRWKQGVHCLSSDGRHCCLGVLCEMAVKEGVITHGPGEGIYQDGEHEENLVCPPSVIEWAGLKDKATGADVSYKLHHDTDAVGKYALSCLNDHGVDFLTIADLIEANAEIL